MTAPQMPEIRLTTDAARRYTAVDYDHYYPVAPGMALIKAAGHTPGSQMVLVSLESGRDVLLIGDAAWHMDGIRKITGKDAPWIVEDTAAVDAQLKWLNGLTTSERNLVIIASHDDDEHKELVAKKLLGGKLE
jgi:glyoxylase-like metal-dependent hydrolase (beta-lactamase superfamily II)